MANNTFPLVLAIKEDGSINAAMAGFENAVRIGAERAGGQLDAFGRKYRSLREEMGRKIADPLGIGAQLSNLSNSPYQRTLNQQLNAANQLAAQQARLVQSGNGVVASAGAQRAAYVGLGQQLQDTVIQAQMGTSAFTILTQQGGQAAYAFSNFGGKIGAAATFLAGWQGAVILAGVALAGNLLPALFRTNDELDDQLNKLRENASKAELAEKAKRAFANTEAGARDAIREVTEELNRQNDALKTNAERLNIRAKQALADLQGAQTTDQRRLDTLNESPTKANFAERSRLKADIAARTAEIIDAEKKVNQTRIALATEAAARINDPIAQINKRYDDQIAALRLSATEAANRGETVNSSLTQEIALINQAREAALKKERDQQAAVNATNREIGRTISLEDARGIVAGIGGRVTSDLRTRAEQEVLYARYKAGTGPLAARPGHSNHELGQALDIAKGEGITLGKIRDAFRARGVQVTELLDEGTHYHVAWKASAAASKEASAATREAVQAQRELEQTLASITARFDPAAAAAADYAATLADIGKLQAKGAITPGTAFDLQMKALAAQKAQQAADFTSSFRSTFGDDVTDTIAEWERGLTAGAIAASEELTGGVRGAVNELRYAASGIADLLGININGPFRQLLQNGGIEGQATDIADAVAKAIRTTGIKFDGIDQAKLASVIASAGYGQIGGQIYSGLSGRPGNGTLGAIGGILGGEAGKSIGASIATSTSSSLLKALGGAAGPLGAIAGGLLGSVVGGLFRSVKFGTSTVSNSGSSIAGNSDSARGAAGSLGEAVAQGVQRIVDQFGGTLGNYSVSIGTFDSKYRVSTTGFSGSLDSKNARGQGLVDFGTDGADAAIRFAIADAIKDGAVQGIRAGTQRLIQLGDDVDVQIAKALKFENVFTSLRAIKDPIGAAAEAVDKEFEALRKIFDEATATAEERAELEELYALKRAEAIKAAQESAVGQLRDLVDDLKTSDMGLSLRSRQSNILSTLSPLIAAIESGGKVDQEDFTAAARTYLDIQRELYGSTNPYFDALKQITDLTNKAIANAGVGENVTALLSGSNQGAIAAAAAAGGTAPTTSTVYVDTASIVTAVDKLAPLLEGNNARLDLITKQLAQQGSPMVLQIGGGGTGLAYPNALRNA